MIQKGEQKLIEVLISDIYVGSLVFMDVILL